MFHHVYGMIAKQKVRSVSGIEVSIKAQTFCVHGDNPRAIKLIKYLRKKLPKSEEKRLQTIVYAYKPLVVDTSPKVDTFIIPFLKSLQSKEIYWNHVPEKWLHQVFQDKSLFTEKDLIMNPKNIRYMFATCILIKYDSKWNLTDLEEYDFQLFFLAL